MEEEIWRPVKGYEERYEVSNFGRVKGKAKTVPHPAGGDRVIKEKIMKCSINEGYVRVSFRKNQTEKTKLVHRLVCDAFHDNPESKEQVNHLDGNKQNNYYKNLAWATPLENIRHSRETGLNKCNGEKVNTNILTENQVLEIRGKYKKKEVTFKMIAREYGVTLSTIALIIYRKNWKHI